MTESKSSLSEGLYHVSDPDLGTTPIEKDESFTSTITDPVFNSSFNSKPKMGVTNVLLEKIDEFRHDEEKDYLVCEFNTKVKDMKKLSFGFFR